jgi:serine phosphatase RsbU (regulator of sigma subunit)/predicted ester cyclase
LAKRRKFLSKSEGNKALVRRYFEAFDEGNLEAIEEMLAPDFVDHSPLPDQEPGRDGYKRLLAEDRAALSDVRTTFEYQATDGDDMVISRLTQHSTHDRGEMMGVAPTGQKRVSTGIIIHRISEGKIAEEWSESSGLASLMERRLEEEARERERVEQELRVARRIQQASLPKEVPTLEGWQIAPYYQPAREVGGDFYDFHFLSEGGLGLVVGDATGKGVPAALVMSTTCGMLRLAAQSYSSPGEMLQRLNETLFTSIPPNMFVTCFYAILDPKSGSLIYANAGHDMPYLRRSGDAEELRARGMPLGLMPGMSYEQRETILHTGEAAFFYSDGLVEAHDPKGEMFGFPRLRALIAEHGDEERSLGEALLEELYSFVGERWEQEDDITLLTLRRSASLS